MKQNPAKGVQPKSAALVNLHWSAMVNDTGFSTLRPQGFFKLILVALCSKGLLYVAECCKIKKLNSKFCASFLEVQIRYKTTIKML
jgi:hypothetical protein